MSQADIFVGADAGGSKTRLLAADSSGRVLAWVEGPGINAARAGAEAAAEALADLVSRANLAGRARGFAAGVAGAWSPALGRAIARGLRRRRVARSVTVRNDAGAVLEGLSPDRPALLLNVGTGAVLVTRAGGRVDGWGPEAGDGGSAAWIGRTALALALEMHDARRRRTPFGRRVLPAFGLSNPGRDLHRLYGRPGGVNAACAAAAPDIVRLARRGDRTASGILREAARRLAATVAAGLRGRPRGHRLFVGGSLARSVPELLRDVRGLARRRRPRVEVVPVPVPPELAILRVALREGGAPDPARAADAAGRGLARRRRPRRADALPVTERPNPGTERFSTSPVASRLRWMNRADAAVAPAVARVLPDLARAVTAATRRVGAGGRLIYAGAGTSGRLGVLDAAEAPPTFGVAPGLVRGLIAGGRRALTASVEGAEDSAGEGRAAIRKARVGPRDTVVGLSASGGARYVLAAVREARRRGALTVAVTCDPGSPLARACTVAVIPRLGPEVIPGSTRLAAGTAQKMILNMLSTCVMAATGRVRGNAMTSMWPANVKLRERAVRILAGATGLTRARARRRLADAGWNLPAALGVPGS